MTTAVADIPAVSPSRSADSRVMIATTRAGSVTAISTCASSPSTSTLANDPREAVARARPAVVRAAEPLDLLRRDDAPVPLVPLGPDAAAPIPAAKRVEADPERVGGVGRRVGVPRQSLCSLTPCQASRQPSPSRRKPALPSTVTVPRPGSVKAERRLGTQLEPFLAGADDRERAAEAHPHLERAPRLGDVRVDGERVAGGAEPGEAHRERLPDAAHRGQVQAVRRGPVTSSRSMQAASAAARARRRACRPAPAATRGSRARASCRAPSAARRTRGSARASPARPPPARGGAASARRPA